MDNLLVSGTVFAEESVIGSMMVDENCIPIVMGNMRVEDFTNGTCRETFRVIQKLFVAGRPADPVTVVDAMQGGNTYIAWIKQVMENTPTAANVESYMEIARDGSMLQRLRTYADKLLACGDVEDARELVRNMSAATSATSRMPRMTADELAKDFLSRMRSTEKPEYLPWGFPTLNRILHTEKGDFNILGGYPSAGKTLLSVQMAISMAKRYRVGYYSLETKPEKMADRMFSHLSGVPLSAIKARDLGEADWTKLAEATAGFVLKCPFDIIKAAGSTVDSLTADAVAHRYEIIFIDYMQLLKIPGIKPGERYSLVTAISSELHLFAQQHDIAIIALSQLARPESDSAGKRPPDMHSLRESGQIEQDADSILLVYPSDVNDNNSSRIVKVAKNKDGPRWVFEVDFDGSRQTMTEIVRNDNVAGHYSAVGRATKQKNRVESASQMTFKELPQGGYNPWEVTND